MPSDVDLAFDHATLTIKSWVKLLNLLDILLYL